MDKKYIPFVPKFGPYKWVIIEYDGHEGFACDWEDCLEEMIFLDGYDHYQNYIKYDDKKLTRCRVMMVRAD